MKKETTMPEVQAFEEAQTPAKTIKPLWLVVSILVTALLVSAIFGIVMWQTGGETIVDEPVATGSNGLVQYYCEQSGGAFIDGTCGCPIEEELGQTQEMMYEVETGVCLQCNNAVACSGDFVCVDGRCEAVVYDEPPSGEIGTYDSQELGFTIELPLSWDWPSESDDDPHFYSSSDCLVDGPTLPAGCLGMEIVGSSVVNQTDVPDFDEQMSSLQGTVMFDTVEEYYGISGGRTLRGVGMTPGGWTRLYYFYPDETEGVFLIYTNDPELEEEILPTFTLK